MLSDASVRSFWPSLAVDLRLCAIAQPPWPTRPVTMVVPFAAGGPMDVVGRIMATASASNSASRSWSRTSAAAAA